MPIFCACCICGFICAIICCIIGFTIGLFIIGLFIIGFAALAGLAAGSACAACGWPIGCCCARVLARMLSIVQNLDACGSGVEERAERGRGLVLWEAPGVTWSDLCTTLAFVAGVVTAWQD